MEKISLRLSEDNSINAVYDNGTEFKVHQHDFDGLDNEEIKERLSDEYETPFIILVSGFGNLPLVVLKQGYDIDEVLQDYVSSEQESYTNDVDEFDQDEFDSIGSNVMGIYEVELITIK